MYVTFVYYKQITINLHISFKKIQEETNVCLPVRVFGAWYNIHTLPLGQSALYPGFLGLKQRVQRWFTISQPSNLRK